MMRSKPVKPLGLMNQNCRSRGRRWCARAVRPTAKSAEAMSKGFRIDKLQVETAHTSLPSGTQLQVQTPRPHSLWHRRLLTPLAWLHSENMCKPPEAVSARMHGAFLDGLYKGEGRELDRVCKYRFKILDG